MIIILAGIPGSGKTTVASVLKDFEEITFGDVMFEVAKEMGAVETRDDLRKDIPEEEYSKIQEETINKIAERIQNKDVIINTHLSIKHPYGYTEGLPDLALEKFKPTLMVIIETDPKGVIERRNTDKTRTRDEESELDLKEHQKINREFASKYSMKSGAKVIIIHNEQGKLEKAQEELKLIVDSSK
ncbi:adenylate kinase [Candidatus Woesearchaeota archaeon]|nr:adenylate kinase [Candidatus Woesearchaeota archaeon]MBT4630785.1 adenylate kinase [Candidatus Woesearchaeota archaeon]